MGAAFFSATIIKHNNTTFVDEDGVVGRTGLIPTPGAGGAPHGDFWAVPITDYGVWSHAFNYEPCAPGDETPPQLDAFHVFRLVNENGLAGKDIWMVRGRTTIAGTGSPAEYGYAQVAADYECCDATPSALPTSIPTINACQTLCEYNEDSLYFAIWQLPALSGNLRYLAYGRFNGVALSSLTATGYTSGALLATAMTSAWGATVGGTFTFANNALRLIQTAGDGDDVICVTIGTVNPSA